MDYCKALIILTDIKKPSVPSMRVWVKPIKI